MTDFTRKDDPRPGLKLVERVLDGALREDGLHTWYRHGIRVEEAIPIDTLRELADEKWRKFCEIRLTRVTEQVSAKRNRYLEIMSRIASQRED